MKGEECKLRLPEDYPAFSNGKDGPFRHKKLIIVAWFLVLIVMSIMIGFTFRSLTEIGELKEEIEKLRNSVQVLQKKVNDIDNPEYSEDTIFLEDNHHYDDEYYDIFYEDDSEEVYNDSIPNETKRLLTGEDFTKDAKLTTAPPRSKRSIIQYTQEDDLNSQVYEEQRKKNITGTDDKIKSTTPSTRLNPYHPRRRVHQDLSNHFASQESKRSKENKAQINQTPKMASYLKSGDSYSSENPNVEFTVVSDDSIGSGRTRHRQRRLELDERPVRYGRMRPLPTAHFSGDTSKYVYGQHENFDGNGRLKHPQRTFVDWAESGWFETLEMDKHFSFSDGILTVKDSGLYFIYAQIYYLDVHDTNGFRVYRNESETLLQCTTMTHSATTVLKGNTCYTAAAEYLHENDRISLGDLSDSRYSLFEPGKSFFGVIKLGDVKILKRK